MGFRFFSGVVNNLAISGLFANEFLKGFAIKAFICD